jgi:hypothetical protein
MRKLILAAALVLGGAAFVSTTPAKAEFGCMCGKVDKAPVCVHTPQQCMSMGGLCVTPCLLPEKVTKQHKHKHHMHKATKPAAKKADKKS